MYCKNCDQILSKNVNFCPKCGAKVIKNRLTFKNLFIDFFEKFFNYDNTFLKTSKDLFTKPEEVIAGYINGLRKRYLPPLSYLTIAITLSGATFFFIKKAFLNNVDINIFGSGVSKELGEKMMGPIMDFQAIIFLLFIPIISITSRIVYNETYKLIEHFVISSYIQAHITITSFLLQIIILVFFPNQYFTFSTIFLIYTIVYSCYVLYKMHKDLKISTNIIKSILYCGLFIISFGGLIIALTFFLFASGAVNLSEFSPQP